MKKSKGVMLLLLQKSGEWRLQPDRHHALQALPARPHLLQLGGGAEHQGPGRQGGGPAAAGQEEQAA